MRLKTTILAFVLLTIVGCKQRQNKEENNTGSQNEVIHPEEIPGNLMDWVNAINNNISTLEDTYDANAIKVISADSIMSSSSQIANYYRTHKNKITSITSLFNVEANKKKSINYELVRYKMDDNKEYVQIVIWRKEGKKTIREFEFTQASSLESKKVDTTDIADRRKLWIELCNANDAEKLVKQLYSHNSIYFNHKPIIKGTEDLIKEYDYMNNKSYSLDLHPMVLEVINSNFAIEIGECSGSYKGKYILVWKKHANGNWNIYIDSNI